MSATLGTEVKINHVSLSLFNRMNLEGVLVRDQHRDTLLYAGQLKVRITDWFFLQDQAVLKFIGLEDAVVKMNRTDSVWNYQFITDLLAASPKKKKKSGGIDFNLKKLDLKNIRFIKKDLWIGELMDLKLGSLLLDAENMNFSKSDFNINEINIDRPFFTIQQLDGNRPDSLRKTVHRQPKDKSMYFNAGDIKLHAALIKIKNGQLWIEANDEAPTPYFDGNHIRIGKLNGNFSNVNFIKDTIHASVLLSAKDRSGLELKRLKAHLRFTPQIMEFSNLDLQTNQSRLGNYYAMKYADFNEDFADYISKVTMVGYLRDTKISSDDIAFFCPRDEQLE